MIDYSRLVGIHPYAAFPAGVPTDFSWDTWMSVQPPGTKDPRTHTAAGTPVAPASTVPAGTAATTTSLFNRSGNRRAQVVLDHPNGGGIGVPYTPPPSATRPNPLGNSTTPSLFPGQNPPSIGSATMPAGGGTTVTPPPPGTGTQPAILKPPGGTTPPLFPGGPPATGGAAVRKGDQTNAAIPWRDPATGQLIYDPNMPEWLRNQFVQDDGQGPMRLREGYVTDEAGNQLMLADDSGDIYARGERALREGAAARYIPGLGWAASMADTDSTGEFERRHRRSQIAAASIIGAGAVGGLLTAGAAGSGLGLAAEGTAGVGAGAGTSAVAAGGPGAGVTFLPTAGGTAGVGAGAAGAATVPAAAGGSSIWTLGNAARGIGALGGIISAIPRDETITIRGGNGSTAAKSSPYAPVTPPLFGAGGSSLGTRVAGYADGGPISGPGGPRDDNLLIAASNNEYVVPADVVIRKGTEFFDRIKEKVREESGAPPEGGAPPPQAPVVGYRDGGLIRRYADGGLVEDDPFVTLGASGSPGLETLPATTPAPAPPLFTETAGAAVPPPAAAPAPVPPAPTGLGMAPEPAAKSRVQEDRDYLDSMPIAQKIGLVLQSYQAGVEGRTNPVEQVLQDKRKREATMRQELRATIDITKQGMEMVRSMPPGKAREAMIEQITRSAGVQGDMVKTALEAVGGADEKEFKAVMATLENPAAQSMLVNASGGDPKKARQLLADGDFMKRLDQKADQVTLPAVTTKMAVLSRAMEKSDKFKGADGKVAFTMADLRDQNAQLPKEMQLTEGELATAARNQSALIPYGLTTDATLQKQQESGAKNDGALSDVAKLRADLKAGRITQADFDAEIRRKNLAVEKADKPAERAPVVVEIEDPNNPGKNIKIDALTGKTIGAAPAKSAGDRNIPAPVLRSMADNDGNIRRASIALKLVNGENVTMKGPEGKDIVLKGDKEATGWKGYVPEGMLQRLDEQGIDARAVIADIGSMVIHDRSGAAVTASEYPRLKPFIPNEKDSQEAVKKKLSRFVAEYTAINEDMRGMFSEEQGYRQPPKKADAPKTEALPPVPKTRAELVKNKRYETARGAATWDGEKFVQ